MTDRKPQPPRPPAGLGTGGRRLWQTAVAALEFDALEVPVLTEACRTKDLCDRLSKEMASTPVLTVGSQGQPRPSPLLAELRAQRALLASLLGSVRVEVEGAAALKSPRHQKAARVRWQRAAWQGRDGA